MPVQEDAEEMILEAIHEPKSWNRGAWRDELQLFIEMIQHWQVASNKQREAVSIDSMMSEAVRMGDGERDSDLCPQDGT